MQFQTTVQIPQPPFDIAPCERMLFVGSCFADNIGKRFVDEGFPVEVNPFGVMYNPVSILHTIERIPKEQLSSFSTAFFTLGTNHVYIEKATGCIVDNCQKRPQRLFREEQLNIDECADAMLKAMGCLHDSNPHCRVIVTVSPIRYAKYGYHESQLSKAVLLLAVERLSAVLRQLGSEGNQMPPLYYFPAYEIVLDELRDYRFYSPDMLHPSPQAVEFIWERFSEVAFSDEAKLYLKEWKPLKEALAHRPFHPESDEYKTFIAKTREKVAVLSEKYPNFALPKTLDNKVND